MIVRDCAECPYHKPLYCWNELSKSEAKCTHPDAPFPDARDNLRSIGPQRWAFARIHTWAMRPVPYNCPLQIAEEGGDSTGRTLREPPQ